MTTQGESFSETELTSDEAGLFEMFDLLEGQAADASLCQASSRSQETAPGRREAGAEPKKRRRAVGVWGRKDLSPAVLRVKAARELAAARERDDVRVRRASRFVSAREVRLLESLRSIRFLGSGRYGMAKLVRWGEQEVVLKKATQYSDYEGFKDEFLALCRLQGAGGAPLPLGLCREPAAMLISYAGATTLEQALRAGSWSEAKAVAVAVSVCRRVEEIHAKGLIHNDLKADNVMLHKALDVSVIDLGAATPEGGVVGYEIDSSFRGEYLAPELLSGGASSRASDAFAVGFLLRQIRDAMKRPSKKAKASRGAQEKLTSAIEGAQRTEPELRFTLSEIVALLKPPARGASSQ